MSFDAWVYFAEVPPDLEARMQGAIRELGMTETVRIPPDWQQSGSWHLLEKPDDKPEGGFIEAGPLSREQLEKRGYEPDERALLAPARYSAFVSTRLSAGNYALMVAGAIARATDGILVEHQNAAFQKAFEADLAGFRGPEGPEGKLTLVQRGFYDTRLAWQVAKAAAAYERRENAPPPAAEVPQQSSKRTWIVVGLVLVAVGAFSKLNQRRKEVERSEKKAP